MKDCEHLALKILIFSNSMSAFRALFYRIPIILFILVDGSYGLSSSPLELPIFSFESFRCISLRNDGNQGRDKTFPSVEIRVSYLRNEIRKIFYTCTLFFSHYKQMGSK